MLKKIINDLKSYVRPELHDPVNAAGFGISVTGCLILLASLVYDIANWIYILAFILWAIGIVILWLHSPK